VVEKDTSVELSVGEIEETVGAVKSAKVVKPLDVSYWLLKVFPAVSFTPVVTLVL